VNKTKTINGGERRKCQLRLKGKGRCGKQDHHLRSKCRGSEKAKNVVGCGSYPPTHLTVTVLLLRNSVRLDTSGSCL
jgi:hypothetical protein